MARKGSKEAAEGAGGAEDERKMGLRNGSDKKKSRKNKRGVPGVLVRLLPRAEISLPASPCGLFCCFGFRFGDFSVFGG